MSNTNDGGAAFPRITEEYSPVDKDWHTNEGNDGMTLRDYFAAKAMAAQMEGLSTIAAGALQKMGLFSTLDVRKVLAEIAKNADESNVAKDAYKQADAMLAERDKTNEVAK